MSFHIDNVRLTLNCVITYFKRSGKMYTTHDWYPKVRCVNQSGQLVADWNDAISALKGHLRQGQRPGLVDRPFDENDFMVELRPRDGESHGYPVMVHIPIDVWARQDQPAKRSDMCTVCGANPVDVDAGFDTCSSCTRRQ